MGLGFVLGLPSVTNLNHDSLGLTKAPVACRGAGLAAAPNFLPLYFYFFFVSPNLLLSQRGGHRSGSAFWMQIDHLGVNTGDRLLLATELPGASSVNADGNLSLLRFLSIFGSVELKWSLEG